MNREQDEELERLVNTLPAKPDHRRSDFLRKEQRRLSQTKPGEETSRTMYLVGAALVATLEDLLHELRRKR